MAGVMKVAPRFSSTENTYFAAHRCPGLIRYTANTVSGSLSTIVILSEDNSHYSCNGIHTFKKPTNQPTYIVNLLVAGDLQTEAYEKIKTLTLLTAPLLYLEENGSNLAQRYS